MSARDAIRSAIEALKPVWLDPPILQPSAIYLELSGEEIRRRAFLVADEGGELCLRPDMTVPAVREAFTLERTPPCVAYDGPVFRRIDGRAGRRTQFAQIGAEWLSSAPFSPDDEARLIALAFGACVSAGVTPRVKLGDTGVREGFLAGCALDGAWEARLRRALQAGAALEAVARPERNGAALADALAAVPEAEAEAALADMLALAGVTPIEGRPLGEIAQRLRARGRLLSAPPPAPSLIAVLQRLMALEGPSAIGAAERLAKDLPDPAPALAALERAQARARALKKAEPRIAEADAFTPNLGRAIGFYDGFVFELSPLVGGLSFGGGGRYDALIERLKPAGGAAMYAAGFALAPDRLESVRT